VYLLAFLWHQKQQQMKNPQRSTALSIEKDRTNILLGFSSWINEKKLAFWIISLGMIVMLLWAGSFKLTAPGAEGIAPLVSNSPLISWQAKLLGTYGSSDLIGITEYMAAILMITGFFKPLAGIIGGAIAVVMFFITSTMLITTPGTLVSVNGIS
jgi:reactive chlorine resistance protein C